MMGCVSGKHNGRRDDVRWKTGGDYRNHYGTPTAWSRSSDMTIRFGSTTPAPTTTPLSNHDEFWIKRTCDFTVITSPPHECSWLFPFVTSVLEPDIQIGTWLVWRGCDFEPRYLTASWSHATRQRVRACTGGEQLESCLRRLYSSRAYLLHSCSMRRDATIRCVQLSE